MIVLAHGFYVQRHLRVSLPGFAETPISVPGAMSKAYLASYTILPATAEQEKVHVERCYAEFGIRRGLSLQEWMEFSANLRTFECGNADKLTVWLV